MRAQAHVVFFVLHNHMKVPGRDPNTRGAKQITWLALPHRQRTLACKTLGQKRRKNGRHMLRNDHGQWEIRGERRQESGQRIGTARRDPDGNNFERSGTRRSRMKPNLGAWSWGGRS